MPPERAVEHAADEQVHMAGRSAVVVKSTVSQTRNGGGLSDLSPAVSECRSEECQAVSGRCRGGVPIDTGVGVSGRCQTSARQCQAILTLPMRTQCQWCQ